MIEAMLAHPGLINRPIVVAGHDGRLCRSAERVLDLLDHPVTAFTKEDGDVVTHSKES